MGSADMFNKVFVNLQLNYFMNNLIKVNIKHFNFMNY